MGILDRIGKVATGVGGAIQAPFGLVKDLALGAFTDDDEFDGFVGTLYGSVTKRGGQLFGNLMGPQEGLGAAIGGLPGAVRTPIRTVADPVLGALEWSGRELIREPLAAGVTSLSLAQQGEFDLGKAYGIAQNRSLGQAGALLLMQTDITDEAELAEAYGSDWFEALSGTMDATARLLLEPDVLIGGGIVKARKAAVASKTATALSKVPGAAGLVEKGVFGRSIRTSRDVEAALVHPALARINDQIGRIKAEAGVIPTAGPTPAIRGYHGTPMEFEGMPSTDLGPRGRRTGHRIDALLGAHFTDDAEMARYFAEGGASSSFGRMQGTGRVIEADLDISNPKTFDRFEDIESEVVDHAIDSGLIGRDEVLDAQERLFGFERMRELEEAMVESPDAWRDQARLILNQDPEFPAWEAAQEYRQSLIDQGFDSIEYRYGDKKNWIVFEQGRMAEPAAAVAPKVDPAAIDRAAARIRDLAFHDHRDGAIVSRVLAESDDLTTAWGALMGHRPSMERMWETRADLAGQISRISGDQARIAQARRMVGALGPDQLPLELPDDIVAIERAQVDVEINSLYDTETQLNYYEKAEAMVRELPRISGASERRAEFVRSRFYQASPMAKPLRLAINMRPRNFVDLHDAAGDAQVTRLLRKSGLDVEEQDRLRGMYMASADPTARHQALASIEEQSIRSLAARYGITDADEIQGYVDKANAGRSWAADRIGRSRSYDGRGRSYIEEIDEQGVAHRIYVPIAATQEFNHFILPDLDAIDAVMKRRGEEITRFGATRAASTEVMEAYQRLWKPSVLIRVGWPLRVVGEEQLRVMSQIGALLTVGRTAVAGSRFVKDLGADVLSGATQAARRIPKAERTYRGLEKEAARAQRGLRLGTFHYRGYDMESAFGTAETFRDEVQRLNSARGSFEQVVRTENEIRNGLRREVMSEWQTLEPSMPGYGEAWENTVNNQVGRDAMWRQFMEGRSRDEVRDWIENTAEGRAYLRDRVPHWRGRVDDWLEIAEDTVNDLLPTDELRAIALQKNVTIADLERAVPDAAGRPPVNGAIVADIKGGNRMAMALGKLRDQAMKTLGTIPTDVLSRQPYFDYHYTGEVKRLVDLAVDQGTDLTPEALRGFEAKARNYALGQSKKLLYDLADESELSHMLRFVSPFYSAWQEVLTRWTGIATDNPAFVARLHEAWRAPERMGIVTDENGYVVDENGEGTIPLTGEKVSKDMVGRDRFVNFRLLATDNAAGKAMFNDLTRHIPGVKRIENAKFNKEGANLILQGTPGVGPLVQIPLNEVAKQRPELEASLRWALPFGASQSTLDMMLPATARRIKTKAGGEEDRTYRNQLMRIYWDMQVDYNLQKRSELPTYAEAKRKTDALYNVRTLASFISPVAPSFQSPYQMYIDAYRHLKEVDPETADEKFLAQYGDEFFPLTQSLSRTVDGVPPTLEGAAARRKYQGLIERNPELGGLIVGAEGAGEFSSAVYQSQLQNPVAPGSADKQRQAFSFEDAKAKPNERLGWIEYSKAMDLIDAERMNRGLPNLQVRGAADLANLKRAVIDNLEKKYPEWAEKFNVTDRGAWGKRIAGMREIAADERLAGRDEIRVLGEYLQNRDQVIAILAARKAAGGASTLNAAGNMDVKGVWDQIVGRLTLNPEFASLYYRWLERDPLALDTGPETVGVMS